MQSISNPIFSERETAYLNFILQYDFPEKQSVVNQLNNLKAADVLRDVTPYYWIMEFRPNGTNSSQGPMHPYISISLLHNDNTAPSVFTLYERNGYVFELEIYNADSSPMDDNHITDGKVVVHRYT